jgi:phosphotransferase system  glucose/maltose/N-acetylglucosamine-specific IIC component
VSPRDIGVATSSATFTRQIGGTLGTAIFLSILFSTASANIASAVKSAATTAPFQAALRDPANAAFAHQLQAAQQSGAAGAAGGVLKDSSFLNNLDARLAKPFLEGFSDSMDLVFLVGSAVMVVGFLVMLMLPHVELRGSSAYFERGKADADAADAAAAAAAAPQAPAAS